MIAKGFRFGMLLQIAVGPVCLFILKTAIESGTWAAASGALAAVLIDALFVTFAIIGLGSLLDKPGAKTLLRFFGVGVLLYFGTGMLLEPAGIKIIPAFAAANPGAATRNAFVTTLILTASNPLTILFWTGVFATKITGEGYGRREMIRFGGGAVLATLVFLGGLALVAGFLHLAGPVPGWVIAGLNAVVALVLIGFGIKMAVTPVK